MSVVTSIEESGPSSRRLTIEVPAPAVDAELGRVVAELRRDIHLPGFRRGKVPASVVMRRFREDIEHRVVDRLVPRYWHQAQAEKNLDTLLPPRVEDFKVEAGEPLVFVATVDIRPEIELGDYQSFDLPDGPTEAGDDDVDAVIDDFRRARADWSPVDRPAAIGDRISGRLVPVGDEGASESTDGSEDADAGARPFDVVLGDRLDERLRLALVGLVAGQKGRYEEIAEDGTETSYRIEAEAVKEQELPELDDELVAEISEMSTVAELRAAVRKDLDGRRRAEHVSQRRRAVCEQLRQRHPVTLPERVVENEASTVVQDYAEHLSRQGVDIEKAEIAWEQVAEQARPEAERRVHDRLLLDAVAEAEEIAVDENEFERFLAEAAKAQGVSSLALRQRLADDGRLEGLRAQLRRERVLRFLAGEEDDRAAAEDSDPAPDTTDTATDEEG